MARYKDKKRVTHFLSVQDIARLCDVSLRTVNIWINQSELKATKIPGIEANKVRAEDFIAFANQNNIPLENPVELGRIKSQYNRI